MNYRQINKIIHLFGIIAIIQIVFIFVSQISSNALATQATNKTMLSFEKSQVDKLIIKASNKSAITLIKKEGKWKTQTGFIADKSQLNNLLDKLHQLKHGLAVATSGNALKRFKVAKDSFERKIILKKADKVLATLYLGSGAGVHQTLARREKESSIYSVTFGTYDVPTTEKAWLDTDILMLEKESISTVQLGGTLFQRENTTDKKANIITWKTNHLPKDKLINQQAINNSLSSLVSLYFDNILGKENKTEYGLDKPVLTLSVSYKTKKRNYQFGKLKDKENYILKVSDYPEYFQLASYLVKPLLESISKEKWFLDKPKVMEEK